MIDNLTFLRQELVWIAIGVAAVLLLIFLWKEYTQTGTKRLMLKAVVAFIAITALLLLFLQPSIGRQQEKGVGVMLTGNYHKRQLDSLKKIHKALSVVSYKENEVMKGQLDSISSLYVLGDGVMPYDFWQFEDIETAYLKGMQAAGIVRLRYNQELLMGDSLLVKGVYINPKVGNKLVLEDPSGRSVDSVTVSKKEDLTFQLLTSPKVAGRFVYRLVEKDSLQHVFSSDPLPVIITEPKKLRILMINTFPTFETKYLKNFLAENGHQVLVRSQLTKNTFKFENFNSDRRTIYGLTEQNLKAFDLVITDVGSYQSLSRASKNVLESQLQKRGMGVFVQPDASLIDQGSRFGFRLKRKNTTETQLLQFPKIKVNTYPFAFAPEALLQGITSSKNELVSAYFQNGSGRMGTTVLKDTYQLVLEGNEEAYQFLWSNALGTIAQKSISAVQWELEDYIAYQDEAFMVTLRSSISEPAVITVEKDRIPLQQDLYLSDQWKGVVYPKKRGWNDLQLQQDSTAVVSFYVADSTDWSHVRAFDKAVANVRQFDGRAIDHQDALVVQPISRLWLFIVFVLAIGFLWFEPRYFTS